MNDDLYKALGIDKDATIEEIKAAHLRKSRIHHPDIPGGNGEDFKVITNSFDILKDPDKRKRYDETGDSEQQQQNPIISIVLQFFNSALNDSLASGSDITTIDLVQATFNKIDEAEKSLKQQKEEHTRRIETLQAVAKRLTCNESGDGLLIKSILSQVTSFQRGAEAVGSDLAQLKECKKMISHYTYEHSKDSKPQFKEVNFRSPWIRQG